MTGAVLPEGADTVVPVERLVREGRLIRFEEGYEPRKGSSFIAGVPTVRRERSFSRQVSVLMAPPSLFWREMVMPG